MNRRRRSASARRLRLAAATGFDDGGEAQRFEVGRRWLPAPLLSIFAGGGERATASPGLTARRTRHVQRHWLPRFFAMKSLFGPDVSEECHLAILSREVDAAISRRGARKRFTPACRRYGLFTP